MTTDLSQSNSSVDPSIHTLMQRLKTKIKGFLVLNRSNQVIGQVKDIAVHSNQRLTLLVAQPNANANSDPNADFFVVQSDAIQGIDAAKRVIETSLAPAPARSSSSAPATPSRTDVAAPMTPQSHSTMSSVPNPIHQSSNIPPAAEESHKIQLLEERLKVNRHKRKVGEVVVRKEIETRIVEVPLRREKLIIEQVGNEPHRIAEVDLGEQADARLGSGFQATASDARDLTDAEDLTIEGLFKNLETASKILKAIAQYPDDNCHRIQINLILNAQAAPQVTYHEFPTPMLAHQFLSTLAPLSWTVDSKVQVIIRLTNQQAKAQYQSWFNRYSDRYASVQT